MNREFGFHSMSPFTNSIRTDGELDSSHEKKKSIFFFGRKYIFLMHSILCILYMYGFYIIMKSVYYGKNMVYI